MSTHTELITSNISMQPEVLRLRLDLGWEGYGIYIALLEYLFKLESYKCKIEDIECIALYYGVDIQILNKIIFEYDLLESDAEYFWSNFVIAIREKTRARLDNAQTAAIIRWEKERKRAERKKKKEHALNELYEEAKKFVELFISLLPQNLKITPSMRESWCKTYIDLVRIDNRSPKEIEDIVRWARSNEFWKRNFLSLNKLRRRDKDGVMYYDRFLSAMSSERIPFDLQQRFSEKLSQISEGKKLELFAKD